MGIKVHISQKVLIILNILATALLAFGYASRDMWNWVLLIIAFGILLLFGQRFKWGWTASFVLVFFVIAAARGVFLDISSGLLLLIVVFTLSTWDLYHFDLRLRQAGKVEKALELERSHLKRLITVAGSGLFLGGIPIVVELKLKFGWMLLLGMVVIISLSRLIILWGREGD